MSEIPPPPGPPPSYDGPLGPQPTSPPPGWTPPAPMSPPPMPPPPPPKRSAERPAIVLGVLGAVLVIALAVLVPVALSQRADDVDDAGAGGGPADRTLDAVEVYEDLATTHTDEPQDYPQSPPVGGPHAPIWLDCGVYTDPVPEEYVVHDLEHGTVWITYEPDLDQDSIDTLAALLPENGILSPYDGLSAPVVVTVWERQLALTGADDPRLPLFIDAFGAGMTAPEPFASCAGGIRPDGAGVGT